MNWSSSLLLLRNIFEGMQRIKIEEPCHENWNAMSPNEQGRHCQKCVKTVHEADALSDEEIWEKYSENEGSLCIRIPAHRVELEQTRYSKMKFTIAAALFTLLLSIKNKLVNAQSTDTEMKVDRNFKTIEKIKITGIVLDSLSDEQAVAFATVILFKNEQRIGGAFTDVNGRFTLVADDPVDESDSVYIEVSHLTYATVSKVIDVFRDSIDCEVYCKEEFICLKSAVIAVDRKTIIQGNMRMGVLQSTTTGIRRRWFRTTNTKTYYSDEIEKMNLGR